MFPVTPIANRSARVRGLSALPPLTLYRTAASDRLSRREYSGAGNWSHMESDLRYYTRRLGVERLAAQRAVTDEARERRLQLVASYQRKIEALTV